MTTWSTIANSEIAVDTPIDSLTETKFRNRDEYLVEVLNGTNSDKIPAQALQTYGSGAGAGLTVKHFQWNESTGSVSVAAGATVYVATTLVPTQNKIILAKVSTVTVVAGLGLFWWPQARSDFYYLRIIRTGDGGPPVTVDWRAVLLAVA